MEWLNYHHLLYFWTVAREGTIARASKKLLLAQSTISGQIHSLEKALHTKLFERVGRNLVLTEQGKRVYRYADEIFSLGRELQATLEGYPEGRMSRLEVGVSDVLPRWIVYLLLQPALKLTEQVQLICHDDKTERLLSRSDVKRTGRCVDRYASRASRKTSRLQPFARRLRRILPCFNKACKQISPRFSQVVGSSAIFVAYGRHVASPLAR